MDCMESFKEFGHSGSMKKAEEIGRQHGTEEDVRLTERAEILGGRHNVWLYHAVIHSKGKVTPGNLYDMGFFLSDVESAHLAIMRDGETFSEFVYRVKKKGGMTSRIVESRMKAKLIDLIEMDTDKREIEKLELAASILDDGPCNAMENQERIKAFIKEESERRQRIDVGV